MEYYIVNVTTGKIVKETNSVFDGESFILSLEELDKKKGIYKKDSYILKKKDFCYIQKKYNMGIKQISDRFMIPYRTVQNWSDGCRRCSDYIVFMMDEILSNSKI